MPIAHLNGHEMYYEVLGEGEPVLCMGGWGTSRCPPPWHYTLAMPLPYWTTWA